MSRNIETDPISRFVTLSCELGNFAEKATGTNLVDSYFGPESLVPSKQAKERDSSEIKHDLESIADEIGDDIEYPLRRNYLLSEIKSMTTVVDWLSGSAIPYDTLVEDLFHVQPRPFPESDIDDTIEALDTAMSEFPGKELREKVIRFKTKDEISGSALVELVEGDLQQKAKDIGELFKSKVYSLVGQAVIDNGVECRAVTDKPWSAYNHFQGNFKSIIDINIDFPVNKRNLLFMLYHEYEHHVSTSWRERAYLEQGWTELSLIFMFTGGAVIAEGKADTAMEFLDVREDDMEVVELIWKLNSMLNINSTIRLNLDGEEPEAVEDYLVDRGFRNRETEVPLLMKFISPTTQDGRPNIWAPYVFNYYIGRRHFVLPAFKKAVREGAVRRFFETLYSNPHGSSSATWDEAFEWL